MGAAASSDVAKEYLLDDLAVVNFIVRGYHVIEPDLPAGLNQTITSSKSVNPIRWRTSQSARVRNVSAPERGARITSAALLVCVIEFAATASDHVFHDRWPC